MDDVSRSGPAFNIPTHLKVSSLQNNQVRECVSWPTDEIEDFLQATRLCNCCLQIFDPSQPRTLLGRARLRDATRECTCHEHHKSCESLFLSVEAGCRICIHLNDEWMKASRVLRQHESFFFERRDSHLLLGIKSSTGQECTMLSLVNIKDRKATDFFANRTLASSRH